MRPQFPCTKRKKNEFVFPELEARKIWRKEEKIRGGDFKL